MSLMKIKDLFHYEKGVLQSTKCTPGEFDFITASSDWKTHNEYTHECEALIFAAAASGSLGRTHYVNGKFISSDLCFILTPKDQKKYPIDLKFYHLIFQAFKDEIVRNTKAGTSKEAIGLTAFGKYELPYFNISKQIETKEKFVTAQESTNGLSTELSHQLDLVKQLRQSFLREAMQGKLTEDWRASHPELVEGVNSASQLLANIKAEKSKLDKKGKVLPPIKDDEIPFEIPESWVWGRLGDIAISANNGLYKPGQYYKESGVISLRMFNIQDGRINLEKVKRVTLTDIELVRYKLEENDLLVNRVNSRELVGKTAIIGACVEPLVFESMNIRLTLAFKNETAKFINNILLEMRAREYFYSVAKIANGQVSINQIQLYNYIIPFPSLPEIRQVVFKLDELMQYCDQLEESIRTSQQQNELLLQQVLREALEPEEISSLI